MKTLSPMEASLASAEPYYKLLHPGLQSTTVPTLKNVLKSLATHFWKNRKHTEMLLDTSYIPSSYKKGPTLNVIEEVRESEGFITLNAQLALVLTNHQTELAPYAMRANNFNRLAIWKRAVKAFCLTLTEGAFGFIAQFGTVGYGAHQAVLGLLVLHTNDTLAPFNVSLTN